MPALAINPVIPPTEADAQAKPATVAPNADALQALAPVALTTADNAPLELQIDPAQLAALNEAAAANPSVSSRIKTVLQRAFALLGTPYRWGGTSPERGFDCSGLVGYVFRTIGIELPRVSRAMVNEGTPVADRTALASIRSRPSPTRTPLPSTSDCSSTEAKLSRPRSVPSAVSSAACACGCASPLAASE